MGGSLVAWPSFFLSLLNFATMLNLLAAVVFLLTSQLLAQLRFGGKPPVLALTASTVAVDFCELPNCLAQLRFGSNASGACVDGRKQRRQRLFLALYSKKRK